MTVYNVNLGIGWASSGVEYAQAYRSSIFNKLGIDSKFIFTDMFLQDNLADMTRNLGFKDDQVIWLYQYFTDVKLGDVTYTLNQLKREYNGKLSREEFKGKMVRYFDEARDIFLSAYLVDENSDKVHRVEYVSRGKLIRKDFYSYTKMFTEYYTPRDGKAYIYQRRFFNEDGSVAYEEIIDGDDHIFKLPRMICYSKEEFIGYFMQCLDLTEKDLVILDRSTGVGQAVFRNHGQAKLGVVVHAEHFSENAVTKDTILWNNFYEYQFSNSDEVDFFVVATESQKEVLSEQFATYTNRQPNIVVIPVGSIDELQYPSAERRPYSLITASRLASEKHVDWLAKAVVKAHETLPNLTFDIYGQGKESEKIKQVIEKNNASSYIRLMGHQDLSTVYKDYELYISASKSEGFGLTLLEAIGSGLPIIGFDVRYGNKTFIRDKENGYLIPKFERDDENAIVTAFEDHIIAMFTVNNLEKAHEVSYAIAKDFLTTEVEKKWAQLVKEMTVSD